MKKIVLLTIFLMISPISYANACSYNGKSYAEGTVIGPYVCTGGKWISR